MATTRLMPLQIGKDRTVGQAIRDNLLSPVRSHRRKRTALSDEAEVLSSIIGGPDYHTRIMDTTKVFRKYIIQRGGWSSDKTL